jgi:serine/threonine protein kinase
MTGQTIARYRIVEKLGEGAMGVVYRAEDTRLKRTVALKFLPAEAVADASLRERFLREAQAAAALDHPNICTVYEIDERDGEVFLVMAFIDGPTLQKKIQQRPLKLE